MCFTALSSEYISGLIPSLYKLPDYRISNQAETRIANKNKRVRRGEEKEKKESNYFQFNLEEISMENGKINCLWLDSWWVGEISDHGVGGWFTQGGLMSEELMGW